MSQQHDCRDCHNCAQDPDDLFCSHESSMNKANIYGLSIVAARRKGKPCGPEGTLFELAPTAMLKARGRLPLNS